MHPKSFLIAFAHFLVIAATAVEPRQAEPAPTVFTAERVYHAVIDQPPYLVEMTSTITWTESRTISDTATSSTPTSSSTPASSSTPTSSSTNTYSSTA